MVNLDEINNSLPKGYSLEEQQGYYFLRKTSDSEIPGMYSKKDFNNTKKLLAKVNQTISNHEERVSGKRLKSSDEPSNSEKQDLEKRLDDRGLSLIE